MTLSSVIIDSREPGWVQSLTFGGVPTATVALDAGDVWAATDDAATLVIERKTPQDLLASIADGRLLTQAAAMREHSTWCYLAITGLFYPGPNGKITLGGQETGWGWAAVQGALLTVQELGVMVVYCSSDLEFEATVMLLANRNRGVVRLEPPRIAHLVGHGEAALAALPGVGPERIKALLEYCGTPAWALSYLTDPDTGNGKVPGVGPAVKANVRRALGVPEGAELCLVYRENGQPIQKQEETQRD